MGYGLPGLVLVVEQAGPQGRVTLAARSLDLAPPGALPAAPREGQRVTREGFTRTMAERLEATQRMLPGLLGGTAAPTPP